MSKRIGYIDAMRGFTMILVVYSHVCGFCLGDRQMALNNATSSASTPSKPTISFGAKTK